MSEEYLTETLVEKEIAAVLNRHSQENASNTPDFILAAYLTAALKAFNAGVKAREAWYGRADRPGGSGPVPEAVHGSGKVEDACLTCAVGPGETCAHVRPPAPAGENCPNCGGAGGSGGHDGDDPAEICFECKGTGRK